MGPDGHGCPPDCVGSQRACVNSEVPQGKGIERERGWLCWWGTLQRSMFCVKAGTRLQVQTGSTISFFCSSYKLKCQTKMRARTCIAICRWEMSSKDLIRYDMRRRKESQL